MLQQTIDYIHANPMPFCIAILVLAPAYVLACSLAETRRERRRREEAGPSGSAG